MCAGMQKVLGLCCTGGKLASLEEFRVQREELMSETAQLEATFQEQERIHQAQIYDIEKKQVIENDRCSVIYQITTITATTTTTTTTTHLTALYPGQL